MLCFPIGAYKKLPPSSEEEEEECYIHQLPEELLLEFPQYLSVQELGRLNSCCRTFTTITSTLFAKKAAFYGIADSGDLYGKRRLAELSNAFFHMTCCFDFHACLEHKESRRTVTKLPKKEPLEFFIAAILSGSIESKRVFLSMAATVIPFTLTLSQGFLRFIFHQLHPEIYIFDQKFSLIELLVDSTPSHNTLKHLALGLPKESLSLLYRTKIDSLFALAVRRGNIDAVKYLLKRGVNPVAGRKPPLLYALKKRDVPMTKLLLAHIEKIGQKELSTALRHSLKMTLLIMENGAYEEHIIKDIAAVEPLFFYRVVEKKELDIMELFLKKGMNPNVVCKNHSLLYWAFYNSRTFSGAMMVRLLRDYKAALLEGEKEKLKPLDWIHPESKSLLDAGQ